MVVFLFVKELDGASMFDKKISADTLMDNSIEVDEVNLLNLEKYLKVNSPDLIFMEQKTYDKHPEISTLISIKTNSSSVPVYLINTGMDKLTKYKKKSGLNIFNCISGKPKEHELLQMKNAAELFSKYSSTRENVFIDELSGFYNKKLYKARLDENIAASLRRMTPLAIIMIELDYFRIINDKYGETISKKIIKFIAESLRGSLRREDFIARVKEERFAIIVNESKAGSESALRRMLAVINGSEIDTEKGKVSISVTAGAAVYRQEIAEDAEVFSNLAEIALIYAKNKKRNGFAFSAEVVDIMSGEDF